MENSEKIYIDEINLSKQNYHELIKKWISLMIPYKNPDINLSQALIILYSL